MTPSARLSAAAAILDGLDGSRLVDPQLKAWARRNRFAGSGDRRAIADRVYTCLRRMRTSGIVGRGASGRAFVLGSLVLEDGLGVDEIAELCTGGYGLDPLTAEERASLGAPPQYPDDAARLDWPDWLLPQVIEGFGSALDTELDALRRRAPLDLRVNLLKATPERATQALASEGIEATSVPICTTALRVPPASPIRTTAAFRDGLIEPQDAASQAVANFAGAQPGHAVLDFCAGAGGKSLALAGAMMNRGSILAHDIDPLRMNDLPERAVRCGVTILRRAGRADLPVDGFDTVLVDAPCSGSGSWRRDPLGKWRLTDERLAELRAAQRDALASAARFVRPGGSLTYATCSVLPSENADQAEWFSGTHSNFKRVGSLHLWPARDGADGFFAARFIRSADATLG